jgi:quercetin dioxygenase-like cupin family protein
VSPSKSARTRPTRLIGAKNRIAWQGDGTVHGQRAFTPQHELLERVTIAPLTAPGQVQAAIFRFAEGGRIVRHPSTGSQIFVVLEGKGRVSGADGEFEPIGEGEAVFWIDGDEHEVESETGLTAVILEADELRPPSPRPR